MSLGLDDYDAAESTLFSKLGHLDVILDYIYGPVAVHFLMSLKTEGRVQYVHIGSLAAHSDPSALKINLTISILRAKHLLVRGFGLRALDLQTVREKIGGL